MNTDVLADDEFHPRQTDSIIRQHGCPEGKLGVAEIQHDGDVRPPDVACLDPCGFEWKLPVVDTTNLSLGAGHRYNPTGFQRIVRSGCPDHGWNAKLARNNRRVAGPSAALCYDRGGNLHHRLPIWARRFRNENLARLEGCEFTSVDDDPRRPDRDLLADRATGDQDRARPLERIAFECRRRSARGHGLGPGLNDVKLPIIGILGPFDIHRGKVPGMRRVVVLNSDRVVSQLEHFRVVDTGAFPSRLRNPDISRAAMVAGIDHAHLLAPERPAQDDAVALPERRLVHVEFVRVYPSLNDIFS